MKHLSIALALGLSAAAVAAPATPATPAAPAAKAAPAAPTAQLPPECAEKMRKRADKMKKELGLTEQQAAALRNENERFRAQLLAARDQHRAEVDRILGPEQRAKADAKREAARERRQQRMKKRVASCAVGVEDDDDEDHDEHEDKGKGGKR